MRQEMMTVYEPDGSVHQEPMTVERSLKIEQMGRRECGWCGKDLGAALGIGPDRVTTGMCWRCQRRWLRDAGIQVPFFFGLDFRSLFGRPRLQVVVVLLGILLGLVVWAATAQGQVPLEARLSPEGHAVVLVRNPTASPWSVEAGGVFEQLPDSGVVILGRQLDALVTPGRFRLQPGESQIVRLIVREPIDGERTYRLEIVVTDGHQEVDTESEAVRAVLVLATRYLVKMRVERGRGN